MATTNEQMNNLLSPDDMMLEGMEEGTFEQAKKDTAEFAKSVARGSITSPITAAADVVDTGKLLPELDKQVKPFFPMYSSIEAAFEELSNLGISRENAVDLIRKATNNKIDLKGDTGEFVGEFISPAAATKAAGAIATSAAKYGPKAVESVSRIAGEAKKLFSDAGGFDDLAVATAGSPSAQTAKMLDSPELPDTSITKIIIGSSGKDYGKKSKAYESARQKIGAGGPVSDSEAQELWNRTGAQEDLVDNDIVYEIPTVNAKLKLTNPKSRYADSPFDYDAGRVTYNPQVKTTLSDILDFDELFEQAPYLKDIEVKKVSGYQRIFGTKAGYNPVDNTIYISDGTPKELTSDLLHEVEHAVQNADGKRFDGGNFNKIMKADPDYKELGGDAGINRLNKLKRDILDDYAPMLPGNLDASVRREQVLNFLDTYGTLPEPNRFIKEVKKLSTNKDSKLGGGTFSYLSDIREWMEENFPDVEYEYPSKISDTIAYIKTASEKDLKDIIKDYRKNNLEGLERYKKIKERAILKYMRDPGEVTARNVQFRFKLSQADPSITRVAPRFTEDKAAKPLQIPDVREGKIVQPRRESERYTDPEVLRDKARELGVPLSDDDILPIAEGQRYYLASKAEQGGDTAQSLAEQTSDAFAKPLDIGVSEFNVKNVDNPNIIKSYTLDDYNEAMNAATTKSTAGSKAANKKINAPVEEGRDVSVRLNLNSKIDPDGPAAPANRMQTIHPVRPNGKPDYSKADSYMSGVTVENGVFDVNQTGRRNIAETGDKVPAASVQGKFTSTRNVFEEGGDVVEIGMNPRNLHLFVDLKTGQAVRGFELATIFRDRVYAKGVTYWKKAEAPEPLPAKGDTPIDNQVRYKFKQGGAVPMNTMSKQMELFEEGGLMDEGGTIDPVSGNDVPPGSTQEEVRDDIPAQLSEGEFVFPADVVRYIGLETLMRMRQEAKMGLAAMEAMGQMGNSEEAIVPDDLPFDMYDLEIEEDDVVEMNTGGLLPSSLQPSTAPMTAPTGQYSATGMTTPNIGTVPATGQAATPIAAASASPYTTGQIDPNLPGTAFTPTAITPVTPTFQETIGAGVVGVDYEFVEFTNEAGQVIRLRRNKTTGQMIDPIPEGFSEKVKEETKVETTPTTGVGTQTTQVRDDGGRDEGDMSPKGATTAFGGTLDSKGRVSGGFKGDISFGGIGMGGIRGTMVDLAKSSIGQLKGQPSSFSLQPGQTATITNVERIRPAGVYSGKPDTYSAQLQFDAETYNDLFTNQGVTSRKDMEAIMENIISTYGEDFLDDPNNVVNVGLVKDTMDLRSDRQAQKDFVEAAQKADDTIRDEQGFTARDRAFGVKDETSSTGYTEGSVIDKAIKEAEADMAREDRSGDQGDRGDSAPDRGMSGAEDTGFGSGTDCLTENMKVKLNGVIDFVTNIKVGDIIDGSVVKEVLHKHMRSGYFVINNELEITNDHPVLANGTWTKPEELYVGDYINDVKVESIKYIDRMTPTVSIVIDGDSFDVYTEGNTYTVHGRYREVRQQAA
jgi:hypothetical protein